MQEADYNVKMTTKISAFGLLFTTLALCVCSCSCSFKNKKPPEHIRVGLSSIPSTLDPRFALDAEGMKIGGLIFQSLVKIGPDMSVQGDAAQTWTLKKINQNFELKFQMKDSLKFSDGKKVTCKDLIFSVKEYKSDSSPFKSAFANIIKQDCNKDTLTLTFDSYSEKVLNSDLPVLKILPKDIVLKTKENFKKNLIGSGPFQVKSQSETSIFIEPNPYYLQSPKLPLVEFKVIKDDFTRFLKAYRGDLDLAVSNLPKNKISSLKKVDFLNVIRKPGLKMTYLLPNFKNSVLKQLKYRKMIYQGLDHQEIIKYKLEGLAQKATSILPPTNPFHSSNLDQFLPKTIENLREKVLNSELSQEVLILKTSNSREAVENGKLIANQLRRAGIRIRHESYEWGTYYKDIKEGNFDLATMTWVGAYDPDIYRIALSSKELPPQGRNRGYYKNSNFDHLVEKGAEELDNEKRKNIYKQAQEIIIKDLAILPLWYEDTITLVHKRLKNYQPSLNGDYSGLIQAEL